MTFCYFDTDSTALRNQHRRIGYSDNRVEANYVQKRAVRTDIKFDDLAQADFILYLLHQMDKNEKDLFYYSWYPKLLSITYKSTPFEMFLKSQSQRFFDKFRVCLRNATKDDLYELIEKIKQGKDDIPFSGYRNTEGILALIGLDQIATRP